MNHKKCIFFGAALVLMAGGSGLLAQLHSRQKLGPPGVKTHPLDGIRVEADLPENVLNYTSRWEKVDEITRNTLPQDTSFGQRRYQAPDGFWMNVNVVLMGTDRTSLHKPQFCLEGQGFHIDQTRSEGTKVHVSQPRSYDLPLVKLVADKTVSIDGQPQDVRAIYVYWYVADDAVSASALGLQRMWLMSRRLLETGVLQRWSYVSCLAICRPGEEDATFGRMKEFIAAAVPMFQLYPPPPAVASIHP